MTIKELEEKVNGMTDVQEACQLGYTKGYEDGIKAMGDRQCEYGVWIYGEHDVAMCDGYRCDRCGFFVPWDYEHKFIDFINDYNFCPNCGARMKGAGDE